MNIQMAVRLFPLAVCLLMMEIRRLAEAGQWRDAIELTLWSTGSTQDDLVRALGVSRGTVRQWRAGEGLPPARSLPVMLDMIEELFRKRLGLA